MRERQARERGARWGSPSPFELEAWPPPFAVSQSAAAGRVSEGAGGAGGRRTRHPGRSPVGVPWRRDFSSWFRVGLGPSRGWLRPVRGSYRPVPKARSSAVLLGTSERLPRHTPVTVKTVLYKQMHVHEAHAASRRSLARETTRNPCGRDRAKASRSRNPASSARNARFQKRCNRNCFSGAESAHEPRPSVSAC